MPEPLSRVISDLAVGLPPLNVLTPDALAPLSDMVGDTRIVAIGESFHHTHEQLVLREHLVRHLISAHGFNTILLEVLTPGPNPIDTFVRGGIGDAEGALVASGARMWRNHETASLICWIREYNQSGRGPVSVQGMDVLAIGPLMRAVLAHVDSPEKARLEAISHGFDIDGRSDQAAYNQLEPEERSTLHSTFEKALAALTDEDDPARERALTICDALEMLKTGAQGWTAGFALRDRAIANAACRLIDRAQPSDRFIILSHNTHIAAQAPTTEPNHAPAGAFLRERYGHAYFALGLAFGRAAFDPPIYGVGTFQGDATCVDQSIAALGHRTALLDLRSADQDEPIRLQGVGIGALPYTEYPSLGAFDALAFVDVLTNARQLIDTELSLDTRAVDATRR